MFKALCAALVMAGLTGVAAAQAPAGAPAGATGICKDGTYSTAPAKSGACAGHKGVQTWYVASAMPAPKPGATSPSLPAPTPVKTAPAAMPAPTPAAAAQSAPKPGPAAAAAAKPQAAGGGHGLVWLNTGSNVYHCYGTEYYGKTKAGAYMSEAEAKGKGAHGVKGATCEGK
ncbi:DUF3761 domain-containing protein [Granulicella tundricola]|uniref:DUF3761 domain-containing protein n=1 Tax=Granulicella tundricola (strain ATCC BAA-1859 / DSM 23138 / MP5ACTX9) TaxID=1198114 RepID=E8X123_GRATM|nr:DUF3761 domain-containing protein [Granulicella tundricola]ADW67889.1 hypothetical protein AciX9_0821 [Granulicella tundricola MP5ACTX9]